MKRHSLTRFDDLGEALQVAPNSWTPPELPPEDPSHILDEAIDRVDNPTHVSAMAGLIRERMPWLARFCDGYADNEVVTIDLDALGGRG